MIKIVVKENFKNVTFENFLKYLKISKDKMNYIYSNSKVNNNNLTKNYILKTNDVLLVKKNKEDLLDFEPVKKDLEIAYEDDDILIVNKSKLLLTHPNDKKDTNTLCNYVSNYYKEKGYSDKIRYIHRLDYETSGLIIFAKHFLIHNYLNSKLEEKKITRKYLALALNKFNSTEGIIDGKIGRDRHHNTRRRVSKTGLDAITSYKVVSEHRKYTLVELELKTGRTHQIRVHLSHINHPIVGDSLYGEKSNKMNRTALHSYKVNMFNPLSNKNIDVEIDLPDDMLKLIKDKTV